MFMFQNYVHDDKIGAESQEQGNSKLWILWMKTYLKGNIQQMRSKQ
jgi:hypothetical protein